jgi:hypothetical protein
MDPMGPFFMRLYLKDKGLNAMMIM